MKDKPVLLLFIDWFAPGYKAGGPISSCINFVHLLKQDYAIHVFTSDTDLGETEPYKDVISNSWIKSADGNYMIYYARKKSLSLQQIKAVTVALNPDEVYLNHMFSPMFVIYPMWLKWKGIINSRVVVCPRGALYTSALSVKPYKKAPFLKLVRWLGIHKIVRFHATSEREQNAILKYFPGSEVMVANDLPGIDQRPFLTTAKDPGFLKCIFVARIHPIKNLFLLIRSLSHVKSLVQLTIVGPVEDEAYWQKCKMQIDLLPSNITVKYAGSLPGQALPALITNHHIFAMPTLGENFGHSIFESLLVGRPVLISDQTPWLQLEQQKVGWDLPLDVPIRFSEVIEQAAAWNQVSFNEWGQSAWQYAKNFIETSHFRQQYLRLFND